ncbi:uncharacterized protein METZ01_LOCUS166681, partial [marine metagenome]
VLNNLLSKHENDYIPAEMFNVMNSMNLVFKSI